MTLLKTKNAAKVKSKFHPREITNQTTSELNETLKDYTKNKMPKFIKEFMVVTQVFSTYQYDAFTLMTGNRSVIPAHIENLIKSFEQKQLVVPMIVNEFGEIIDGQHRRAAAMELNKPVYFIICSGYGLNEIQQLNTNQKNWSPDEYAKSYCDRGYEDYIQYRQFRNDYQFGHQESMALLTNSTTNLSKIFNSGQFKIHNLKEANKIAALIRDFQPYYNGFRRKTFVFAMMQLFKHPEYDHAKMLAKIKLQQRSMVDCTSIDNYIILLEELYNYHNKGKKVIFRI